MFAAAAPEHHGHPDALRSQSTELLGRLSRRLFPGRGSVVVVG